ncbi:PIN domain-containing protein [Allosaccharopolyspora coralli]|uniref:Ribonuclease VapC n=1 Tax=Allosaccharopolyspora coralli TaxID=2665642 RepID=A0A5Q3QLT6_9PSEU|nr:PIN domain-containing protein [Allosaccharopolyspora coralli]
MILVDTSVWIEWLRATGSTADKAVQELRGEPQLLATTPPVRMEVLAGVSPRRVAMVSDVLDSAVPLAVESYTDFDTAAELFRAARATGRTVRSLLDCVIAAVAIREQATLLHRDHDFVVLSEVAPGLVCHSTVE